MVRPVESEAPVPSPRSGSRVVRTDATPDKQAEHRVDQRGEPSNEKRKKSPDHPLHADAVELQGPEGDADGDEEDRPGSPKGPASDHIDVTG